MVPSQLPLRPVRDAREGDEVASQVPGGPGGGLTEVGRGSGESAHSCVEASQNIQNDPEVQFL